MDTRAYNFDNLKNEVRKVVDFFCEKQGWELECIDNEAAPDIICCCDYYFSFSDIVLDIQENAPAGEILRWISNDCNDNMNGCSYNEWIKGWRPNGESTNEYKKWHNQELENAKQRMIEAQNLLNESIKNTNKTIF